MNTQQTLINTLKTSETVLNMYIGDLTDAELMTRPGEDCNHIAWQLGHLIASECNLLEMVAPGSAVELPAGFAEKHSKETTGEDDPSKFCTKQEYVDLAEKVHAATIKVIENANEADFDKPSPEHFQSMFPTMGHMYVLIAMHPMMHVGQFAPVRRKLGKPIVI